MKKIVVFTGAGVSAESGVATFRDTTDGLWYNYNVEEVATVEGWRADPVKVLEFHNMLRAKLKDYEPNDAHKALVALEEKYKVTIITQNVDDLHERAGSKNVLHLHGELYKSRSTKNPSLLYECLGEINIGDKCELGSQLRPHTVLFGEYPYNLDESYKALMECDYLLIVGTSLQISYTLQLLKVVVNCNPKIFYIDPNPYEDINNFLSVTFIKKGAVEGVTKLVKKLMAEKI